MIDTCLSILRKCTQKPRFLQAHFWLLICLMPVLIKNNLEIWMAWLKTILLKSMAQTEALSSFKPVIYCLNGLNHKQVARAVGADILFRIINGKILKQDLIQECRKSLLTYPYVMWLWSCWTWGTKDIT